MQCFLSCALLLNFNIGFSQRVQIEFFANSKDFSNNRVNLMAHDDNGFIWLMGNTVDRYDGHSFIEIGKNEKGLADYFYFDENVMTNDFIINKSKDHFYLRSFKTGKVDSVSYKEILSPEVFVGSTFVHEQKDGTLFFFTINKKDRSVNFLKLVNGSLEKQFSIPDVNFQEIEEGKFSLTSDCNGNFYCLDGKDGNRMLKFDKEGNILDEYSMPKRTKSTRRIFNSGCHNDSYLYIDETLYYLNSDSGKYQTHPSNVFSREKNDIDILSVLETEKGNLWLAGTHQFLAYYDQVLDTLYRFDDQITSLIPRKIELLDLMLDKTGVLWIKTILGVIKVVPQRALFDTYFTQVASECGGFCSFRGITEGDDGAIYASFYDGIFQIDPITKITSKPFPGFGYSPFGLGYKNGKLFLNDGRCLDIASGKLEERVKPIRPNSMDVGVLIEDEFGHWWLGENDKVFKLNDETYPPKWEQEIQLPNSRYGTYLHYGKSSQLLWTGSGTYLTSYDINKKELITHFPYNSKENIHSIYEDKEKTIWLGLEDGLIAYQPSSKTSRKYTVENGIAGKFVCGILPEGDSCLWLATNSGLSRMNIAKEEFLNFYEEDGLPHNEFNRVAVYKSKAGQMFFGGMQGITAFYPEQVLEQYQQNQNIGRVVLSSVSRIDEKLDSIVEFFLNLEQVPLTFNHWDKSITLKFSLTDFRNPEKNKYSYLMEGFDKVWSNPSKFNFAKFNVLPPGEYIFRARTLDAKGHWNPNELAVPIVVYPPWWKTNLAYVFYLFLFCGLLFGLYRLMRYRWELQSQFLLEQKEAHRLKELDRFKSRLFTNLTHEFRTPLTVILGMTDQLKEGIIKTSIDQKKQNDFVEQTELISRNGKDLLRLVNQLLDLSKLENNAFKLKLENNNVLSFLSYVTESFHSLANQKNISLKISTFQDVINMDFDPNLLQQVIANLISNAIKFSSSGGAIWVKINQLDTGNEKTLQIEIEDNGIGIEAEKLPNIFDRFYQVDGSTTRAGEGTGIGLAHSLELIKLMKGSIEVESEIGIGSVFRVKIPIINNLPKQEVSEQATFINEEWIPFEQTVKHLRGEIETSKTDDTRPRILVIEDNVDVVTYLKKCLEPRYQVDAAYNGDIGIAYAQENIPDLIISDVMMPGKDGFQVCAFLKEQEETSHIPIILLTAKADLKSKLNGLKRGADAYIAKPFDKEELLVRIAMLIKKQETLMHFLAKKVENKELIDLSKKEDQKAIQIEDIFIQKVIAILDKNYADENFALPQLCQKIGLSRTQLYRKMKAIIGQSPSQFIRSYRLNMAKQLLETTELNVSEVAWKTGFVSPPHFSRVFQEEFGVSPSTTSK